MPPMRRALMNERQRLVRQRFHPLQSDPRLDAPLVLELQGRSRAPARRSYVSIARVDLGHEGAFLAR
jgi:hypothetical protein